MLKEQLLQEAKSIDASVELDSIFESVELSEEVKANFSTVFGATVKSKAIELAESHINQIAESAEQKVEELVESRVKEVEDKLVESADTFMKHLSEAWLEENKLAIDKGIKSELFESMFEGLKTLFVEHNVVIPEESVDVVAELEQELDESIAETKNVFDQLTETRGKLTKLEREVCLKEQTEGLTETQKEKVGQLVEGLDYNDTFSTKVTSIVEMVKASKEKTAEEPLVEATINTIEDNPEGLNYTVEAHEEEKPTPQSNSKAAMYAQAASRLNK